MRALRLAAAFLAILASPQLAPPAGAVSSSGFNLSCSSAAAGSDVNCTVTRITGGKGLYVLFQTSDITAHAGTDYTAVSQLLYLRASAVTQTVAIHTVINRAATGTLTFGVAIAVGNIPVRTTGSIVEPAVTPPPPPPATQTCPDGSVILATAVCPVPVTVTAEPVIAPNGTKGEFDVADNFDVQTTLIPTVETVPASLDPAGAFRFTCLSGQLLYDDPIVYPGQPHKSHLHQFFGNTGTNANSTYQNLRTSGGSTCTRSTDVSGQRTAYWMPAMLDGAGNAVKPDFLLTYYKALPASSPDCGFPDATHIGYCTPLPNGLRFIRGYNMANGAGGPNTTDSSPGSDAWKMGFDCEVTDGSGVSYTGAQHTIADILATGKCPIGAWLRAYITLPDCWDGVNLDTADHRSHMVNADGAGINGRRACPADHPYNIPEIALQVFFRTDANFEAGLWHLSSDEMLPGFVPGPSSPVKAGTSLHFDYWEAWSPVVKNLWQTGCINGHLSCNVGELGNGQTVTGMQQNFATIPNHVLVPLSSL